METKYTKVLKKKKPPPLTVSWARWIQSRSTTYSLKIHFYIILPSTYIFQATYNTHVATPKTCMPYSSAPQVPQLQRL